MTTDNNVIVQIKNKDIKCKKNYISEAIEL